jgi:transposase-like protein
VDLERDYGSIGAASWTKLPPPRFDRRSRLCHSSMDRNRTDAGNSSRRAGACRLPRIPSVQRIAKSIGVNHPTVYRWQQRFAESGIEGLLRDKTRKPCRAPIADLQAGINVYLAEHNASPKPVVLGQIRLYRSRQARPLSYSIGFDSMQ